MEFRMSCVRYFGLAAIATAASSALPALANESFTTRIEPRSFYGAAVTVEEGVRVFRPLPPHKHVVINPENKTPVNLSFNEFTGKSHNYHYGDGRVGGGEGGFRGFAAPGLPFGFGDTGAAGEKNGTSNPGVPPRHHPRQ
jgi:hypothetical protein